MDDVVTIAAGVDMPRLGLGVFRAGEDTSAAVEHALSVGLRHLDTAAIYRNEEGVGQGVRRSGVPRSEVFVTTKLWNDDHGYDAALRAFEGSLERLGMDHVDLYLVHWPVPALRRASWRALEAIHASGRARAIGVSNYTERHLQELFEHAGVRPAVNQVEVHPFLPQRALRAYCAEQGVHVVAYSPLTKGRRLDHPVLVEVARELGCDPAQVLIRWGLDEGLTVLPKSSNPARIAANARAAALSLSSHQKARLDALDDGTRTAWDPTDVP